MLRIYILYYELGNPIRLYQGILGVLVASGASCELKLTVGKSLFKSFLKNLHISISNILSFPSQH